MVRSSADRTFQLRLRALEAATRGRRLAAVGRRLGRQRGGVRPRRGDPRGVPPLVERFDRRGTEPFESFRSKFIKILSKFSAFC